MSRPTTVERAYQLAQHGPCLSLIDIRLQLKREGHEAVESHLAGRTIASHLRRLCRDRAALRAARVV